MSVTTLPGLMSFSTPCLRWKMLAGVKPQWGYPNFTPPYQRRFLNQLVTITSDNSAIDGTVTVRQQLFTIDRITGEQTPATLNESQTPAIGFPYNNPAILTDPLVTVSDTHFTQTILFPTGGKELVDLQLSNEYQSGDLEADADALIAGIDTSQQPQFTLLLAGDNAHADPSTLIPVQVNPFAIYGGIRTTYPMDVSGLEAGPQAQVTGPQAAAFYAYIYGVVGADDSVSPNVLLKVIANFAMAGKYCLKTYTIDYNQTLLNQACASGMGSCANTFTVKPPPFVIGQNAYVTVTPNCQCGG